MDMFYNLPNVVANSAKYYYDGGILISILKGTNFFSSNGLEMNKENILYLFKEHSINTLQSGGFIVGLLSTFVWIISILITIGIIWKFRFKDDNKPALNAANSENSDYSPTEKKWKNSKIWKNFFKIPVFLRNSRKKLKNQSYFNRLVLVTISLSTFFTLISGIFGFIATSELHVNLSTHMKVSKNNYSQENVHKLLNNGNTIIPRIISGTAHLKIYLDNFYENTLKSVNPVIDELIEATVQMQTESSLKFSQKLEEILGTDELSKEATQLIDLNIKLRDKLTQLDALKVNYQNQVKELEKNKRNFAIAIDELKPGNCSNDCRETFTKISYDIKVKSPIDIIPSSLVFIHNELKNENLEEKHLKNDRIREEQRTRSIEELNKVVNISQEVRNSVLKKFHDLDVKIRENKDLIIEKIILYLNETEDPIKKYPQIILGFNVIFWSLVLLCGLFTSFNVYIYFMSSIKVSKTQRSTLKALSCLCYAFICFMLIYSCMLFMTGGYMYTEACRYMNPMESLVSTDNGNYKPYLDTKLNELLDDSWEKIVNQTKQHSEDPLPKVRDIIYGLSMNCQNNVGILAAFSAIDSFDYSSVNDPQLTNKILSEGKKILAKTIREFDLANFMDQKEESSLGQIHKTDANINTDNIDTNFFEMIDPPRGISWDEMNQIKYNLTLYTGENSDVDSKFGEVKNSVKELMETLANIKKAIEDFNAREKASPLAHKIIERVKNLRDLLNNREELVKTAEIMYDNTVVVSTGPESLALAKRFGPKIMSSLGKCLNLHYMYNDFSVAMCSSLLGPLNCLWFFAGIAAMFCTIGNLFSNLFLYDLPFSRDDRDLISEKYQTQTLMYPVDAM